MSHNEAKNVIWPSKPVIVLLAVMSACNAGVGQDRSKDHSLLKQGDLKGNLRLLNLGGEQPQWRQRLYETGYSQLASKTDATLADVAAAETFQMQCKEHV